MPTAHQGLKVLLAPVGHPDYIQSFLTQKGLEHDSLFEMIPQVPDVQATWLPLLSCASTRTNFFFLRTVAPEFTLKFAERHEKQVFKCLSKVLQTETLHPRNHEAATMPLTLGVVGLGDAQRTRDAALWRSWADSLEMIRAGHPEVASREVKGVAARSSMCLGSVADSAERLKTMGAKIPSWEALAGSVRPGTRRLKDREPNEPHHGWQKVASTIVNIHHKKKSSVAIVVTVRAGISPKVVRRRPFFSQHSQWIKSCELIRSRSGCCCCAASACHCPFPAVSARVAVLLTSLAITEQHAARWGCLARGLCRISVVAQICREGGARVSTNVMVRDFDIAQENSDSRRGFVSLWRSATGSGRDIGVCAPWRWIAVEESRHNQWSGSEARSQAEGRQEPRIVWDGRKSQDGGCCR